MNIPTYRHNQLIGELYLALSDLLKSRRYEAMHGEQALAYEGNQYFLPSLMEHDRCSQDMLDYLPFVQPDFMLFKVNRYLIDKPGIKLVGLPNLIIEIWNPYDTNDERNLKRKLYSSKSCVEHWYISQDCNLVDCWLGNYHFPNQHLTNVLKTIDDISIDLRYLAL